MMLACNRPELIWQSKKDKTSCVLKSIMRLMTLSVLFSLVPLSKKRDWKSRQNCCWPPAAWTAQQWMSSQTWPAYLTLKRYNNILNLSTYLALIAAQLQMAFLQRLWPGRCQNRISKFSWAARVAEIFIPCIRIERKSDNEWLEEALFCRQKV